MQASFAGDTRVSPGRLLRGHVSLHSRHCSNSGGEIHLPRSSRELEIRLVDGPALDVRVHRGRFTIEAPADPGVYEIEIGSVEHPDWQSARLRFVVEDPGRRVRTRIRLRFPRGRPGRTLQLTSEDGSRRSFLVRGGIAVVRIEPGDYRATSGARSTALAIAGPGDTDATFAGSTLTIELDGLPSNERQYRVQARFARGPVVHIDLHDSGAQIGTDVPPGPASLSIQSSTHGEAWHTIRLLDVVVAPGAEQTLLWSTSNLLAGRAPQPGAWFEVAGAGTMRELAPPGARALAVRNGFAVAVGRGIFEHDGSWSWWRLPRGIARGARLTHHGPTIEESRTHRVAIAGDDRWAWIEGGPNVLLRTATGIAQERIELYSTEGPYPCYSTDIAADAETLFVVGHCRPHAPERDRHVAHEGFIAERGPERWHVQRGFRPLRAVAHGYDRTVAVGDSGEVATRANGRWSRRRVGREGLWDIALSPTRLVARTERGLLVEIPQSGGARSARVLHHRQVGNIDHPVSGHCFVGERLVIWHGARSLPNEGSGPDQLDDVVLVRDGPDTRTLRRFTTPTVAALACDESGASLLVHGGDHQRLEQIGL